MLSSEVDDPLADELLTDLFPQLRDAVIPLNDLSDQSPRATTRGSDTHVEVIVSLHDTTEINQKTTIDPITHVDLTVPLNDIIRPTQTSKLSLPVSKLAERQSTPHFKSSSGGIALRIEDDEDEDEVEFRRGISPVTLRNRADPALPGTNWRAVLAHAEHSMSPLIPAPPPQLDVDMEDVQKPTLSRMNDPFEDNYEEAEDGLSTPRSDIALNMPDILDVSHRKQGEGDDEWDDPFGFGSLQKLLQGTHG